MIPNISPRDLKRMLKRMGINVEELENVERVNIVTKDREIIIENPQIIVMKGGSQTIYQVIGVPQERSREKKPCFPEEDIEFIVSQTGVSREKAEKALMETNGDIAEAIMLIREGRI